MEDERTTLLTPRLRRVAVITAIVAFALVSLVLGNELMFLITFCLLTLLGLAKVFAHWTLKPLHLEVSGTPEAVEGQEVTLQLRVVNKGILPRYLVEVRLKPLPSVEVLSSPHFVAGQLLAHQFEEIPLRVRFRRRGLQSVDEALLWAQDPLGLFIATRSVILQAQVLVYPRPKPLGMEPEGAMQQIQWEAGRVTTPLPSVVGEEFWGVRPYQSGDPLKRIHWKITAHQGELSIIQTLPSLRFGGVIFVDRHPAAHRPINAAESTLDELVRYAAYLVREWVRHYWQVLFWVPPDPPLRVDGDWHPVWRQLALLEPQPFHLQNFSAVGQGVILTTPYSPYLSLYRSTPGWQVWILPLDLLTESPSQEDLSIVRGR